jgi:hypothetical protein
MLRMDRNQYRAILKTQVFQEVEACMFVYFSVVYLTTLSVTLYSVERMWEETVMA